MKFWSAAPRERHLRFLSGSAQQQTSYIRQSGSNFITQMTDPLSRQTDYGHDSCGNLTSVTRLPGTSLAATTTFTYQTGSGTYPCIATFNRVTSVRDPLNRTTTFGYDAKGNLTSIANPLNETVTLTYDAAGQPATLTNALSKTWNFTWESGALTAATDPLGRTVNQVVDAAGRVTGVTDPLGRTTLFDYDPLNRLTRILDPLRGATSLTWDPNGNLESLSDPRSGATNYAYDNRDRLSTRTDPLLKSESFSYDLNGNLSTWTDRKSQGASFTHDGFDRLTQASYADGSTTGYTYDNGNRVTQISDSLGGTITLSWDDLDRLTREATPQGTIDYTYDLAGQRASMTVQGQAAVNYGYEGAGRLAQITQGGSTVGFTYDAAGRRTSVSLPNGITMAYTYDIADQLTGIDYKQGATVIGDLSYEYDAAGNRVAAGGSFARTGLPPALASAVYDAANRLVQWGGAALTYDDNGNLTSDGSASYTWNARDQLTATSGATFQYDGLGRRTGKTVGGWTTNYLHDGMNVAGQFGAQAATLLTGLGIDETFTRTDSAGARHFLTDALGSTLALADGAGTVQTEYTFQPFGGVTVTGQPNANPFQFTGRENDDTGLYYYRARYYHPGLGRFIAEDPAEFVDGPNLYSYAGNSPLDLLDRLGLCVPECFAQLKYRDVKWAPKALRKLGISDVMPANHAFWWIQTSSGQRYILSAGPSNPAGTGYLQVFPVPGNRNKADHLGQSTAWKIGPSQELCPTIDRMLQLAKDFPNTNFRYDGFNGPNSNSAARYLGRAAGLKPTKPWFAWGWESYLNMRTIR